MQIRFQFSFFLLPVLSEFNLFSQVGKYDEGKWNKWNR